MRISFIFSIWLLAAASLRAADPPAIKLLSYSKEHGAKIIITNPTTSPIYFEAPPGRTSGSIEVLDGTQWLPQHGDWCGTDRGFVELPAGGSVTYEVRTGIWLPRGAVKFRFHIWYVSKEDYASLLDRHFEGIHAVSIYTDPTDA